MKKIILLLFFLVSLNSLSQKLSEKRYLIVTYELTNKKDLHKSNQFCWITTVDSLKTDKMLSPLYLSGYSKTDLDKCIEHKKVNVFSALNDEDWNLTKEHISIQEKVKEIVMKERKKVLTVKMIWLNGISEKINIYFTPVKGEFCNCPIAKDDGEKINYYEDIYLPCGNIEYDSSFWNNKNSYDYSILKKMRINNVNNMMW